MHFKSLVFCFIVGLSSLSLASCSDEKGDGVANGHGHSHDPTANSIHDSLDSK